MTVAYATLAQLLEFVTWEAAIPDAERQLLRATELIDATVLSAYTIDDTTQLATDTVVAQALADAVCAQVEFWLEVGEEHDIDGLAGTQVSVTGYSGKRAPVVAPRALRFLQAAGLMRVVTTSTTAIAGCC